MSVRSVGDRREVALEWAAAARATRQRVRREMGDGTVTLAEVVASGATDELVGQLRLLWVLESLPGARKTDTRRALGLLALDGDRPLCAQTAAELDTVLGSFPLVASAVHG